MTLIHSVDQGDGGGKGLLSPRFLRDSPGNWATRGLRAAPGARCRGSL